jgi:hypothetical protein
VEREEGKEEMKTFKSFYEFSKAIKEETTKDITKYSPGDLKKFSVHGSPNYVYSKFLYMDKSSSGIATGNIKGTDGRINDKDQKPTALYITIIGPEPGGYLYPAGAYYVGHDRVNAIGEVVMGWTGTARLVTYDKKDAIAYIKKFGNVGFQKKQLEKGSKGFNNWPTTYDLTGDFEGQGSGSDITRIDNLKQIRY